MFYIKLTWVKNIVIHLSNMVKDKTSMLMD